MDSCEEQNSVYYKLGLITYQDGTKTWPHLASLVDMLVGFSPHSRFPAILRVTFFKSLGEKSGDDLGIRKTRKGCPELFPGRLNPQK